MERMIDDMLISMDVQENIHHPGFLKLEIHSESRTKCLFMKNTPYAMRWLNKLRGIDIRYMMDTFHDGQKLSTSEKLFTIKL